MFVRRFLMASGPLMYKRYFIFICINLGTFAIMLGASLIGTSVSFILFSRKNLCMSSLWHILIS